MRNRIGIALLLTVFAVGCTAKTLPSRQPLSVSPLQFAANEWRAPSQAIVITDASGTMYKHQTFPDAKALTQSFVKAMPEGNTRAKFPGTYDASLIGFGGYDRIVSPLAPFDRGALASRASSLRVLGDPKGYGGTTPLDDVFDEVNTSLKGKKGIAAVVIFSDGRPQESPKTTEFLTTEAAKRLIADYSGDVCIHTVHLGDSAEGAAYLASLASLTSCGSSRAFADVREPNGFMGFTHDVFAAPAAAADKPDPCEGRIVLRGVEFAFDRAEVAEVSTVILDFAAAQLSKCPNVSVQIEGHTDALGSDAYNQGLGQRRAESVKQYFTGKGVRAGRLTAQSYGESRPVASNDTDEGRQMNRRVELHPR